MNPPPNVSEKYVDLLLKKLHKLIEDKTKHSSSDIRLVNGESVCVEVSIGLFSKISFDGVVTEAQGMLPATCKNVGEETFVNQLEILASRNKKSDLVNVEKWMGSSGIVFRNRLSQENMLSDPSYVGFHKKCHSCNGAGQVGCSTCRRTGECTCNQCNGNGDVTCFSCHGQGRITCSKCHGNGRNGNTYCSVCKGSGIKMCTSCAGMFGGSGRVRCPTCSGRRVITCRSCRGGGILDCGTCNATGYLSTLGTTQVNILSSFRIKSNSKNKETTALLDQISLEDIEQLCPLAYSDYSYNPDGTLVRLFKGLMTVTKIEVEIISLENQKFEIQGYGSSLDVFDYKNIIGKILSKENQQFINTLNTHRYFSTEKLNKLIDQTKIFLESEINVDVANAVAERQNYSQTKLDGVYSKEEFESLSIAVNKMLRSLRNGELTIIYGQMVAILLLALIGCTIVEYFLTAENKAPVVILGFLSPFIMIIFIGYQVKSFANKISPALYPIYKKSKLLSNIVWPWIFLSFVTLVLFYGYLKPFFVSSNY